MVFLLRWRAAAIGVTTAGSVLGAAAFAQQATPVERPYKPIGVTLPDPFVDKSLDAFRKQLAAIVQRKDRAALARVVAAKDFFWESDVGGVFNAKKSGFDNLNAALRLADADARGWGALAVFAAETTAGPTVEHPQAHCAPAQPDYEDAALAELTEATNTDVVDWSYPRAPGMQVHGLPAADAPVVETLGLNLVRVLGYDSKEHSGPAWIRVATPGGEIGYVPPGALVSPLADRLCFGKEGSGWRIVGYVGTGD